MKIFLSGIEGSTAEDAIKRVLETGKKLHYNLMSYYYLRGRKDDYGCLVRDNSEAIMIDSGAHSFQFGKKVDFVEYTKQYAEFIKDFDRPNVVGFSYYNGVGVVKDFKKAIYWYTKAADQGYADAQFNIGVCYELGHGVNEDFGKAIYWYNKVIQNPTVSEETKQKAEKAIRDLK